MARFYDANQIAVAAATDMDQTWAFTITQNNSAETTEYYSLKDYSYDGDSYEERVLDDGKFKGFKLKRGKSGYNIHVPDRMEFTLDNSDGSLTASDYEGATVLVELIVGAGSLEEVLASAKYKVNAPPRDQYETIVFSCIDFVSDKLDGMWPNTPKIKDLFPSDDAPTPIMDNMCVPVIIGDAYIPLRSVYVSADMARYYVLGLADGETYEIEEVRSPRHQTLSSTWVSDDFESAGFAFNQATKASGGVNYRVFQPIISDSDSDDVPDANGLWFQGDHFLDIPVLYRRNRTKFINGSETGTHDGAGGSATLDDSTASWPVNGLVGAYVVNRTDQSYGRITANTATQITATLEGGTDNDWDASDAYTIGGPASVIRFVMTDSTEGMGFDSDDIDDTAFGSAELVFSEWNTDNNTGLVWNGGWYFQQERMKVIADLLNMCHGYFETGEKIALRILSKTSQVTLDKDSIEENSFKWQPLQIKETDSAYVYLPKSGEPFDKLYPIQVPAKASYSNPSNAQAHYYLIDDTQHAQNLRSLSIQRIFLKDGVATFSMFPNHLKIMPDDVITVDDTQYGTFTMFVESIDIDLDLTMKVKAYTTTEALDDYDDMAFPVVEFADHTGDTTTQYKFITAGPDGPPSSGEIPNVLPGRLRVGATGNYILLDPSDPIVKLVEGGQDRIIIGDLTGSDEHGIKIFSSDNKVIFHTDHNAMNKIGGFYATDIDFWGGHATLGNAAVKAVIGDLDTTPKIAIGLGTADSMTIANYATYPGMFADGTGDFRVGGATSSFVYDEGDGTIKITSGATQALHILGGGDILLTGDDSNPAKLCFSGTNRIEMYNKTAGDFYVIPESQNTNDYYIGTDNYEFGVFEVLAYSRAALYATDSNTKMSWVGATVSSEKYVAYLYSSDGIGSTVDLYLNGSEAAFYPGTTNILDLGTTSLRWKDGWFAGDLYVDGYIGIGTTAPDSCLHVWDLDGSEFQIHIYQPHFTTYAAAMLIEGPLTDPQPWVHLSLRGGGQGWSWGMHGSTDFRVRDYDAGSKDWFFIEAATGLIGMGGLIAPLGNLHVQSGSAGSISPSALADELILEASGHGGMSIYTPDAYWGNIYFGCASDDNIGYLAAYYDSGSPQVHLNSDNSISITTATSLAIYIDSSQQVGIGTTPAYTFDVYGDGHFSGDLTVDGTITGTSVTTGTTSDTFTINSDLDDSNVQLILGRTTGGNATFQWNGTIASFDQDINLEADVGIGTATPVKKLHIYQSSSSNSPVRVESSDEDSLIEFKDTSLGEPDPPYIGCRGDDIQIGQGGVIRAYFELGGNMGIGTASPQGILHIYGGQDPKIIFQTSAADLHNEMFVEFWDSGDTSVGRIYMDLDDDKLYFDTFDGFNISGMNVGIGTTTPDGKLHVMNGSAGTVTAHADADDFVVERNQDGGMSILTPDAYTASIFFGSPTDNDGARIQYSYDGGLLSIGTNVATFELALLTGAGAEAVRIDGSGFVGIGTNNPVDLLHIYSGSAGTISPSANADELVIEANGPGGISIYTPDANWGSIYFGSDSDDVLAYISAYYGAGSPILRLNSDDSLQLYTAGSSAVDIDSSQNIVCATQSFTIAGPLAASTTSFIIDSLTGYDGQLFFNEGGNNRWKIFMDGDASSNPLKIYDYGAAKILMTLYNGAVGIGDETPTDMLTVRDDGTFSTQLLVETTVSSGVAANIRIQGPDADANPWVYLAIKGHAKSWLLGKFSDDDFHVRDNSGNHRISVADSTGYVTMPAVYSHDMGGETMRDLQINNSGELGYDSSLRESKMNEVLLGSVSWIHQLKPYEYERRAKLEYADGTIEYLDYSNGEKEIGLFADEVALIRPEIIYFDYSHDGSNLIPKPIGINYKGLITPMLVEIQRLEQEKTNEVDSLDRYNDALARIAALQAQIDLMTQSVQT